MRNGKKKRCGGRAMATEGFFAELQSLTAGGYEILKHLKWVYLTLCGTLAAAAVGVYLNIFMDIDGFLTFPVFLASVMWLRSTPQCEERKRLYILILAAFLKGASVGSLIQRVIEFDSRILVAALVNFALSSGCFSAASIMARSMKSFWAGGLIASGFSSFIWLHLAGSTFGESNNMSRTKLNFGLLLFLGYIIKATNDIILKANNQDLDYVMHAFSLWQHVFGYTVEMIMKFDPASQDYFLSSI